MTGNFCWWIGTEAWLLYQPSEQFPSAKYIWWYPAMNSPSSSLQNVNCYTTQNNCKHGISISGFILKQSQTIRYYFTVKFKLNIIIYLFLVSCNFKLSIIRGLTFQTVELLFMLPQRWTKLWYNIYPLDSYLE